MKWQTFDGFSDRRSATIDGDRFVAVGIASSSEIDMVRIGGHVLAPRGLVPFTSQTVEAIRGSCQSGLGPNPGQKLVLQLYECGDALVPPGPRSPFVIECAPFVHNGGAVGAATEVLRVPFSGRTKCQFAIKFNLGSGGGTYGARVTGTRYHTNAFQRTEANPATDNSYFVENSEVLLTNAVGIMNTLNRLATVFYVGGDGDQQEAWDELMLSIYGISGEVGGETIIASAEASGER